MSNGRHQTDLAHISVIVPVKNEAGNIRQVLESLSEQTQQPSEIVIVDGGSTDETRANILDYRSTSRVPIVLIETDESLPGRARNLAIAGAKNEWIACIDAGIHARADWIYELAAAAKREPQVEVIYGTVVPVTDTYFTECAAIVYVPGGHIKQSIASCLLRRDAWVKAGGFREDLRSGEDLLFFQNLLAAGVPTTTCAEAVVAWDLTPRLTGTFRRFAIYSRNGMRAGLARQWQFNVSRMYLLLLICLIAGWWFWPLLFVPPVVLLLRAERRIWSWYRAQSPRRLRREMLNPRRVLTVASINMIIDVATFWGMWLWFVRDRLGADWTSAR
jgi:glycosyltransferase involved in cell wall biosynthesis